MDLFSNKSIDELICDYKSKKISVTEVVQEIIKNSEIFSKFRVWNSFDKELLIKHANKCQKKIDNGINGRLIGIPVGVKDVINTYDYTTEMGSDIWKGFEAGNDARIVHNIRYEGGFVAGKTVTAEFAVHALNETLNPYDVEKTPGTSSSGSAAAVALGIVPIALATQTGASIIRPSSFCGVYGYKPSFGLIPRVGVLKTTDSLDSVGFITSNVKNLRSFLGAISVNGPDYPFVWNALKDVSRNKRNGCPWKIAFIKTYTWNYAEEYAKEAIMSWINKVQTSKNFIVEERNISNIIENAHEVHKTIYDKSLSYYFKNEYKQSGQISEIMSAMIDVGKSISVENYIDALQAQNVMINEMDLFMHDYDAIISLSTAGEAVRRGDFEKDDSGLIWTLLHLPSISVPEFVNKADGMPFGLQICARKYNDYLLMDLLDDLLEEGYIPRNIRERNFKTFDI